LPRLAFFSKLLLLPRPDGLPLKFHHLADVADDELRIVVAGIDVPALRYNRRMADLVIHISEEEAARDFAAVLARVRAGAEVLIEKDARPVAVLRPAGRPGRLLSESIALAEAHGSTVTLDGDFSRDLEAIIDSHREPLEPPAWD
jgi:antitoxin (DNA-binding transcriptional repressor) of toxin-antitoxin stability system